MRLPRASAPTDRSRQTDAELQLTQLAEKQSLPPAALLELLTYFKHTRQSDALLFSLARKKTESQFGKEIYIRGLIEWTNYCTNDCYYCGIRKSNLDVSRYRLTHHEILSCCAQGYRLGFRTFVLQGGEDPTLTDDTLVSLITAVKSAYPDCALTLSLGERTKNSYQRLYQSGADRYLLRHETACEEHYRRLHPSSMSLLTRKRCLWNLKEIGFQVGAGMMVGSPFQTTKHLMADLLFLQELQPQMIGMGPFISHHQTPFAEKESGSFSLSLQLLSLLRLMHPRVLLPATTALSTMNPRGRELGILAGANVIMPNLSPVKIRKDYALYDNKCCTGCEAAEGLDKLVRQLSAIDRTIAIGRGDYPIPAGPSPSNCRHHG